MYLTPSASMQRVIRTSAVDQLAIASPLIFILQQNLKAGQETNNTDVPTPTPSAYYEEPNLNQLFPISHNRYFRKSLKLPQESYKPDVEG